jgi:2,4-dienoyl-CoA reductase-like NADH-dependent reductase (Old Yellow Enzyme family)
MKLLFTPYSIRSVTFKHRIVISPMCQYSSTDGFANDWHLVHLGSRAVGGAALVFQEATAISPEGRITASDLGIWKDEHMEKLRQIVHFIHAHNALAGVQLAHAGRKASCKIPWEGGKPIPAGQPNGWQTVSPSPLPFYPPGPTIPTPSELDMAGIEKIKQDFRKATVRAKEIGYDVLEIHAAHGYLLHQFYSPLSNRRTDTYGGSFDNRVRLLLEITEIVRKEWHAGKPLFVRISATEWTEGGWNIDDSIKLSSLLKQQGVDLIDTSSGGNIAGARIPSDPGYQVPFAAQIRQAAGIATGAVGLITTPQQAEDILAGGSADLILIARASLRDPYFPLTASTALHEDTFWPQQYERAKPAAGPGGPGAIVQKK